MPAPLKMSPTNSWRGKVSGRGASARVVAAGHLAVIAARSRRRGQRHDIEPVSLNNPRPRRCGVMSIAYRRLLRGALTRRPVDLVVSMSLMFAPRRKSRHPEIERDPPGVRIACQLVARSFIGKMFQVSSTLPPRAGLRAYGLGETTVCARFGTGSRTWPRRPSLRAIPVPAGPNGRVLPPILRPRRMRAALDPAVNRTAPRPGELQTAHTSLDSRHNRSAANTLVVAVRDEENRTSTLNTIYTQGNPL